MTREAGCKATQGEPVASSPPVLDNKPPISVSLAPNLPILQSNTPSPRNEQKNWNTKNLPWRLGSDVAAAASAGALVAPVITIIDRGIIENASGRSCLRRSLQTSLWNLLVRPHTLFFSRPFALIFMVYSSTYLIANTLDTASSTLYNQPAEMTTAGVPKFVATSSVNMSLGLIKDSQFAKMFGPKTSVKRVIPPATYALFALRDCMTIFASFNLPPLIAPLLPLSEGVEKNVGRASAAQFLAPAAIQLASTPLHLLGLDLYNRSATIGWRLRLTKVRKDWMMSSLARMCRIVPAFGVGGVVNARVRKILIGQVQQ